MGQACNDDPLLQQANAAHLPYEGIWEPAPYLQITPKLFDYLREKVGWNIHFTQDAHGCLTPIEAARQAMELEPFKLFFLEDPIGPENARAMRLVREASTTPIVIGEVISSKFEILPMIFEQTVDYMRCSPIHTDGITEAKKLSALAEPFEVKTAFHGPGDVSPIGNAAAVHIDLAISNFGLQESVHHPDVVRDIITGGPNFEDGYLKIGIAGSLGVDINEQLAAKYPYQRNCLPIPRRKDRSVQEYYENI
jgi:mannonate dehydratase